MTTLGEGHLAARFNIRLVHLDPLIILRQRQFHVSIVADRFHPLKETDETEISLRDFGSEHLPPSMPTSETNGLERNGMECQND